MDEVHLSPPYFDAEPPQKVTNTMNCPRCGNDLMVQMYREIEVDQCQACGGMWLDYGELDQLEDTAVDAPGPGAAFHTSIFAPMFKSRGSDLQCPKCSRDMRWLKYGPYQLELDFCPADDGFWLDKGEEKRVLDTMKRRAGAMAASDDERVPLENVLVSFKSRSFLDRVRELFGG